MTSSPLPPLPVCPRHEPSPLPAPELLFLDYFGSSALTSCPVSNSSNLVLDFRSLSLDGAESVCGCVEGQHERGFEDRDERKESVPRMGCIEGKGEGAVGAVEYDTRL
eukprot:764175-Hanusia_phi.AAC.1